MCWWASTALHSRRHFGGGVRSAQPSAGPPYPGLGIGSRGRGLAKSLLGRLASHLVRQSRIPLLVVGHTD